MKKSLILTMLALASSALFAVPCMELKVTFSGDAKAVIELGKETLPQVEVLPAVATADKQGICKVIYIPISTTEYRTVVKLPFTFKGNGKVFLEARGVDRTPGKANAATLILADAVRLNQMVSCTAEGTRWEVKDVCRFDGKSYFSPKEVNGEAEVLFEALLLPEAEKTELKK